MESHVTKPGTSCPVSHGTQNEEQSQNPAGKCQGWPCLNVHFHALAVVAVWPCDPALCLLVTLILVSLVEDVHTEESYEAHYTHQPQHLEQLGRPPTGFDTDF